MAATAIIGLARVGAARIGYSATGILCQVGQRTTVARVGVARVGAARVGATTIDTAIRPIDPGSFSFEQSGWTEPPTCRFAYLGTWNERPAIGDTVIIAAGSLRNRLFTGRVTSVDDAAMDTVGTRLRYQCEAEGLLAVLRNRPVFGRYSGTAGAIAATLLSAYAPELTVYPHNIGGDDVTVSELILDGETVLDACNELARRCAALFWVDALGCAHFAPATTTPAPFDIGHTGYIELTLKASGREMRNRVIVRHSTLQLMTQTFVGDGTTTEFPLAEDVYSVISLTEEGVAVSYGTRYAEDNSNNDYSIQYDSGYITSNRATLAVGRKLIITYLAKVPARLVVDDMLKQSQHGMIAHIIDDRTILSVEDARAAAEAYLATYAAPQWTASYRIYQTLGAFAQAPLAVGHTQRVNTRGVDVTLMVQRVSLTPIRSAADWSLVFQVAVELGATQTLLSDILTTKKATDIRNEAVLTRTFGA